MINITLDLIMSYTFRIRIIRTTEPSNNWSDAPKWSKLQIAGQICYILYFLF